MLKEFLTESIYDNFGEIQLDKIEKFIQFNFDITEKSGGVFLVNSIFISFSKKDIIKSVVTLINSIQNFSHNNWNLAYVIYNELEKGNKIVIDRLSTDYKEKDKFIRERKDTLCNVTGTGNNTKHLPYRKYYYYKCALKRIKYGIKIYYSEPFIIKDHRLTEKEAIIYENNELLRFMRGNGNSNSNTYYITVDEELYNMFKCDRRISIIEEIS